MKSAYEDRVRVLESNLAKREVHLAILAAVAERVHGEEDETLILDLVIEEILTGLGLRAAWIFLGDQKDRKLHLAASRGVAPAYLEGIEREGLSDCLCPEVFWTGHTMQARNTTECPRMPSIVLGLAGPVVHACIPLRLEGAARGVLNVAARPDEQFSDDDLRFLETVGHQTCVAIERAGHQRAERLRNQEARALVEINRAIGGSLDAEAVLEAVGRSAREILRADRAQIFLGAVPEALTVAHLSGLPHPCLRQGQTLDLVATGSRLQRRALEERSVFTVDDWAKDERVNRDLARKWDMASGIVIPLVMRDEARGLLVLTREKPSRWAPEQIEVAEALAAQAAVAIENARLYEESRAAYREVKEAQDRIVQSEKMAVLGIFASGLAHEVRNPLNSIALQLSILERRVSRLEDHVATEIRELIGVIREEIQRLDALAGDFLLFSRTNRIQHAPTDLESLIDEVVRLVRPEARATGVTLRRQSLGEPIPTVRLDAEKMKQVILNLIRNAIEAMPGGGTAVIESGVVEGRATVLVRDNGPGLPEDIDVFQLFVTTKARGTGLGLSIAQQIVLEHGGEIVAENRGGGGAAFTVSLPLAPEGPAAGEEMR